jgi:XTP/dITP diphosphohydrolase
MVFASSNTGKIAEMKQLIEKHLGGYEIELLGLKDIGFTGEIIEDGDTFEANAEIKARAAFDKTGLICFADDSGLCVDYLNGAPGVHSALYGGVNGERPAQEAHIAKLLHEMKDAPDSLRTAHFHCTIYCVVSQSESFCVDGKCSGIITRESIGEGGFGFDPVFYYPPENRTFAQMTSGEKNKFSHRAKAAELFAEKIVKYIK